MVGWFIGSLRAAKGVGVFFLLVSQASANCIFWDQVQVLQEKGIRIVTAQARPFELKDASQTRLFRFLRTKGVRGVKRGDENFLVRKVNFQGNEIELTVKAPGGVVSASEIIQILGSLSIPFTSYAEAVGLEKKQVASVESSKGPKGESARKSKSDPRLDQLEKATVADFHQYLETQGVKATETRPLRPGGRKTFTYTKEGVAGVAKGPRVGAEFIGGLIQKQVIEMLGLDVDAWVNTN